MHAGLGVSCVIMRLVIGARLIQDFAATLELMRLSGLRRTRFVKPGYNQNGG